jgi:D-alanyl-lipoteichoic acid acyltransferase DltB (MBOAT superfamily)
MGRSEKDSQRRLYFGFGLFLNLGALLFFKYISYVSVGFSNIFTWSGTESSFQALAILFPLGLSFYTFKLLSYLIDVYRGRQKPEANIGKFALFVSFFPTLVAGPIERGAHFLPQIDRLKNFS